MSDPTVTAFLTKLLCSHGGRLSRDQLSGFLDLSTEEIEQILRDEPQKFPVVGDLVLARNPVRICTKYLKNEEEEECDKLHLCRYFLQGKCWPGKRPQCNLSHEILSNHNWSVLKENEISWLSENEVKVLLFQNDNQLLPEVCVKYVHDTCHFGEDCLQLHICSNFTQGKCRGSCHLSHNLLEFRSYFLLRCNMSEISVQNFQMISTVKHNEHLKSLREKGQKIYERGRTRKRKISQELLQNNSQGMEEVTSGSSSCSMSGSRPTSEREVIDLCSSSEDDDNNDDWDKHVQSLKLSGAQHPLLTAPTSSVHPLPTAPTSSVLPLPTAPTSSVLPLPTALTSSVHPLPAVPTSSVHPSLAVPTSSVHPSLAVPTSSVHSFPAVPTSYGHPSPAVSTSSVHPLPAVPTSSVHPSPAVPTSSVHPLPAVHTSSVLPLPAVSTSSVHPLPAVSTSSMHSLPAVPTSSVLPLPAVSTSSVLPLPAVPTSSVLPLPAVSTSSVHPSPAVPTSSVLPLPAVSTSSMHPSPAVPASYGHPSPAVSTSSMHSLPAVPTSSVHPSPAVPASYGHLLPPVPTSYGHPSPAVPISYGHPLLAVPTSYGHPLPAVPTSYGHPLPAVPTSYGHPLPAVPISYGHPLPAVPKSYGHPLPAVPTSYRHPLPAVPTSYRHPLPAVPTSYRHPLPAVPTSSVQEFYGYNAQSTLPVTAPKVFSAFIPVTFPAPSLSSPQSTPYLFRNENLEDLKSTPLGHQTERTSGYGATELSPERSESDKVPDICLSNLWKYCKLGGSCPDIHYYLPYRWQVCKGIDWEDISNMEEIENSYCDPKVDRVPLIDFLTMRSGVHHVRRLSTVSSVVKPSEYVLTTEWLWYWKDEYGTWTQYGYPNVKQVSSTILSSDLENVYLSDPTTIILITIGKHDYEIKFQGMKQKNIQYKTERDVRRRPRFLSFEDVKLLRGSTKSASATSPLKSSLLKTDIYPQTWEAEALPEIGCAKVLVSETSSEFSEIVSNFMKTVNGHKVKKMWRLQNPSLWQVFQWQKEQMKKVNQGQDVKEIRLFHGTKNTHIDAICNQNFDWRICGTHGTTYGQGSYFARDASYSHNYSMPIPSGTRTMFIARVLVGDYVTGNPQMKRPPTRPGSSTRCYDSCVDNPMNPSIFVVFEKHQIYPEYLLEYEKQN